MTTEEPSRQFLFIGSLTPEAALSKLKTGGIHYRQKRLDSRPYNWEATAKIIGDAETIGVAVKLTAGNYKDIVSPIYADVAPGLIEALRCKPHVVLIHESVLAGVESSVEEPPVQHDSISDELYEFMYMSHLERIQWSKPPNAETREAVNGLLERAEINVVPYQTNAEFSVIVSAFIDDAERSLLFRVYVPSGRLYAAEADKLLGLFRDYLNQVGRQGVRQDGYSTAAGHVYEFFGNASTAVSTLSEQFDDFANFLETCVDDPRAAEARLERLGVEKLQAPQLVHRYSREGRRLQQDLRQERESRMLALRHRFESELLDVEEEEVSRQAIARLVENLVPPATGLAAGSLLAPNAQSPVTVNVSQQIIHAAQGAIVHNVQGTANYGVEAKQLLELVDRFGGEQTSTLQSAVHELEDTDARHTDRIGARQQIKAFLFRMAGKAEGPVLDMLQKYVEAKLGL